MNKLKIAIQKRGRLSEKSLILLEECGIKIDNSDRKLKAEAHNFPVEILFLRDDDIPQYVEDGVADIGFVGENVVYEKSKKVEVAYALGFGKCRLSFAVNKNETFTGANYLSGKKIAVDISIYMYKFSYNDTLLENMYLMLSIFKHYNVVPIFVFDGKPPTAKKELLIKRKNDKK